MWLAFAIGSALFAGLTSILAKCGIKHTDSDVATAIRTIVVVIFAWIMVAIVGSFDQIWSITSYTMTFLILSGICTGASWLTYFKALQLGDVNKVVPIDKSSTVLTIILAIIFLSESINVVVALAIILIGVGTMMMIEKKDVEHTKEEKISWLVFAFLSAIFASLTAILGKVGIEGVESNLGTAIRCIVVLGMAWLVVLVKGKMNLVKQAPKSELGFVCASGLATGASWLCYFRALQDGPASIVVPIDKLSIVVSIVFSFIVFNERLTKKSFVGLILIVIGTLTMTVA